MNKRGPTGLPTKPYMQNNGPGPGPAPPLPSGPPPVQMQQQYPQQGQPVDQAAHAAAWAAYYQAQGVNPAASYSAAPQPAPVAAAPGTAANPYANYGYGAGATHGGYPAPVQQGVAGPSQSFRPPQNAQPYGAATPQPALGYGQQYPQQNQAYSPNPAGAGYSTPQPQTQPPIQGQGRPPYQQQAGYGWGAQQPATPAPGPPAYGQLQAGAGVPQQQIGTSYPQQAGPYYPQQQQQHQPQQSAPQQPYAGNGNQPYRPPMTPQQHSPYRPPGVNQHRPPRPPISTPIHAVGAGFPPAKRPRFDGPGSIGGGIGNVRPPNGPMQNSINRPPSAPAAFNAGVNGGQPGFNASSPSRGGMSGNVGRGGAPIPTSRPPIHLGGGGPPPFGIGIGRGGAALRGGLAGRGGRGGSAGIGMVGAPRGPSGMMRRDNNRSSLPPVKKDLPKKEKRKEELRTTMTDFRIIGIEVKGLDWSWGKIGGQDEEEVKEEEKAESAPVPEEKVELEVTGGQAEVKEEPTVEAGNVEEDAVEPKQEGESEVKVESADANGDAGAPVAEAEAVEEKRGEKRKAKSPDSEEETAAKKRNSSYLLTHNKPNNTTQTSEISIFESNQNRFRIYFDSPPELDRIPKSARRKRGRESSSVAPSRTGDAEGGEVEPEVEHEAEGEGGQTEVEGVKEEESAEVVEQSAGAVETPQIQDTEIAENGERTTADPVEGIEAKAHVEAAVEGAGTETVSAENIDVPAPPTNEPVTQDIDQAAEVPAIPTEQHVEAEVAEEIGDVSMITDLGLAPGFEAESAELPATDNIASAELDQAEPSNEEAIPDAQASTDAHEDNLEAPEATANGEMAHAETAQDAILENAQIPAEPESAASITTARRHSIASSIDSKDYQSTLAGDHPLPPSTTNNTSKSVPSTNRLSILYEKSSRRICIDSDVVERVKIWRKEGKIEVEFKDLKSGKKENQESGVELPKGILVESYDSKDQRFITLTSSNITTFYPEAEQHNLPNEEGKTIPPFHKFHSQSGSETESLTLTVYLNKKNPLSEPKWCRNNSADNWLYEQFGSRRLERDEEAGFGFGAAGWKGKLEVMDPDPAPTLRSILESWASTSTFGSPISRQTFIISLLSSPLDTLEILLKLTRGDRNPIYSSNPISFQQSFPKNVIRKESPYINHQTHISLAILAMYRLTTDLVDKVSQSSGKEGEEERLKKKQKLDENINDIITSLPVNMIQRSLDGLWKEWNAHNGSKKVATASTTAVPAPTSVPTSTSTPDPTSAEKVETAGDSKAKEQDEKSK